jgi:UDP-glucose 4-epimerase
VYLNKFTDKKVLVVGGAGFVGNNLVKGLLKYAPKEIIIIDNLLSSECETVPVSPVITFIEGSITDDGILAALDDDMAYVFHLATFHGNQNSIHDPLADHANNTLTTLKLYERIHFFKNIEKVIYSSAGCTVSEKTCNVAQATREDAPVSLHFDSPYQISKIVGELYSNYYWMRYKLPVVKARFQNVYGPGEILGAGRWRGTAATVWRNVIPTFIYKAIKGQSLPIEGSGEATRDFIYVADIVEGLLLCATRGLPGEVYNLASGTQTSIRELARSINEIAGNTTPSEWSPVRNWDRSGKRFGSTEKSKKGLGFEARVNLRDGLKRTIDWTRNNLTLVESCIERHSAYTKKG